MSRPVLSGDNSETNRRSDNCPFPSCGPAKILKTGIQVSQESASVLPTVTMLQRPCGDQCRNVPVSKEDALRIMKLAVLLDDSEGQEENALFFRYLTMVVHCWYLWQSRASEVGGSERSARNREIVSFRVVRACVRTRAVSYARSVPGQIVTKTIPPFPFPFSRR